MPSSVGPNTFGEENLVFGYDTGDTANSYRGEPTENLIGNFVDTLNEDYWIRATNYYELEATAYVVQDESAPGGAYTYVTGNTSNTNAQLFWSAGNTICNEFGQQVSVSAWLRGSGEVRLIAYDDTTGYKSGPAITLTGEWTYHKFSTTFGSGGAQNNHWVGVREITTGEYVHIAKMQWERNSHATQYIKGTRSATQGLIDLTGNSTINLTNVSFDSNAQMTFDGTNDQFAISDPNVGTTFSIEIIIKVNDYSNSPIFISPNSVGIDHFFRIGNNGRITAQFVEIADSSADGYSSTTVLSTSNYYHVVISKSPSNGTIYINGVAEDSHTPTLPAAAWTGAWRIGARWNSTFWFNGELPVMKVYNRALTASEIKANYNAIKGRFNI